MDPPGPGRIGGHYFRNWCPSIRPENKTRYMRPGRSLHSPDLFLKLLFPYFSSYDLRGGKFKHWTDKHIIGNRASFVLSPIAHVPGQDFSSVDIGGNRDESGLSVLTVKNARSRDEGLYRCRVDFRAAPTRNSMANLTVIGKNFNI